MSEERRPLLAVLRADDLDGDVVLDDLVARSRRRSAGPWGPVPSLAGADEEDEQADDRRHERHERRSC